MAEWDVFDNVSPLDYQYRDEEVMGYLSQRAFIRYQACVEREIARGLWKRGVCSREQFFEIRKACFAVTAADVALEEKRVQHNVQALVNCITAHVSDAAKPFVHLLATSADILDTADAMRFQEVVDVYIPVLTKLERVLITLTLREAATKQIGRTHLQHMVPITFGYAVAEYVSRLGQRIVRLEEWATNLRGKCSGAVGAYHEASLLFDDPEAYEEEVLGNLGMGPSDYATQIVQPEFICALLCEVAMTSGVLANLADDLRNLQRPEIGEVGEFFEEGEQVGSSAAPHKQNPWQIEGGKSAFKVIVPRLMTVFADLISDHQRDNTNSLSRRTYGEMLMWGIVQAKRMTKAMEGLHVNRGNMQKNLMLQQHILASVPLRVCLGRLGYVGAHEKVGQLAVQARKTMTPLWRLAQDDPDIQPFLQKLTPRQQVLIANPEEFLGKAVERARTVAWKWAERFGLEIPETEIRKEAE